MMMSSLQKNSDHNAGSSETGFNKNPFRLRLKGKAQGQIIAMLWSMDTGGMILNHGAPSR
jgi:hypothetical protein